MGTRLKINVERGSACLVPRVFEGTNFGMLYAIVSVGSGADDIALRVHDHRAHPRIGRCKPRGMAGEIQRTAEKSLVGNAVCHRSYY